MISKIERFWIAFILRFAFGFLFLFAAINIFNYGESKFAADLGGAFGNTWLGDVEASVVSAWSSVPFEEASRNQFAVGFLKAMPYVMAALAVCIFTGILLRPALRIGALLFVLLGLGKYLQNDIGTTANDFAFALMICVGLYFLSLPRATAARVESPGEAPA